MNINIPQISGPVSAVKFIREQLGCSIQEAKAMHDYLIDAIACDERRHFAGLAMQGHLSETSNIKNPSSSNIAKMSVDYADALLAELSKDGAE